MKYTKSALGLLNARYRSVLKKCLLINLGLFVLAAPANAADTWGDAIDGTNSFMDTLVAGGWNPGTDPVTGWGVQQVLGIMEGAATNTDAVINAVNDTTAGLAATNAIATANQTAIATLNGTGDGSVAKAIADAVDGLASEDYVDNAVSAAFTGKTKLSDYGITNAYTKAQVQDKFVAKVDGKGLSTNDYTDDEKTKLAGIEEGAQVNVIETIKVNGTALTPDADKAVDITVPTKTSELTNDSDYTTLDEVADAINSTTATAVQTAVDARVTAGISALDATASQDAGADGLALSITQENGVITSISGSIAAETYDEYGAADAVKDAIETKLTAGATGYDLNVNTLQTAGNATIGGKLAVTDNITTSEGNIVATTGNITATAGNITATAGSITAGNGITATAGNITATAGSVTAGNGVTATAGNITASAGNIVATAGDVIADAGKVSGKTLQNANETFTVDENGNTTIGGGLDVTGDTSVGGGLDVTGDTNVGGALDVTGNTSVGGELDVTGNTSVGGELDVTGNTSVGGELEVTGDTSVGGELDVTGNTSVGGELEVTGDTSVGGALDVTGDTSLGGNLEVAGTAAIAGDTTIGEKFSVKAEDGSLSAAGGKFTVNENGAIAAAANNFVVNKDGNITKAGTISAVGGLFTVKDGGVVSAAAGTFQVKEGGLVSAAAGEFQIKEGGLVSAADGEFEIKEGGTVSAAAGKLEIKEGGAVSAAGGNFLINTDGSFGLNNEKFEVDAEGNAKAESLAFNSDEDVYVDTIDQGEEAIVDGVTDDRYTTMATTATVAKTIGNLTALTEEPIGVTSTDDVASAISSLATNVEAATGGEFDEDGAWEATVDNSAGSNGYVYTAATNVMAAVNQVAANVGTADDFTNDFNGVGADYTVNANINTLNGTIGDMTELGTDLKNLTNGGDTAPATVVEALNNIDASIGDRQNMASANDAINEATKTSVADGLTAAGNAIGDLDFRTANYYNDTSDEANLSEAVRTLDTNLYRVDRDLHKLKRQFNSGMASMAAMTALVPNSRSQGNTSISLGTGAYNGNTAMALGGFHYITDNVLLNAGAAWGNSHDMTYRLGVTWSF